MYMKQPGKLCGIDAMPKKERTSKEKRYQQKKYHHSKYRIRQQKGQSILISHAILVGISVALVLIVVHSMNSIREDYQEFVAANEIEQTCFVMRNAIEKVYAESKQLSPTNTTYGRIRITLPDRIADFKYRTTLENRTVYLNIFGASGINSSCKIGLNASYTGFTTGGVTEIKYTEYTNGTRVISFEKVS